MHSAFTHQGFTPELIRQIWSAQGTFYGQQDGQDAQGTCSYNENFANTVKLPWSSGTDMTIALNDAQFENGNGCGLCIKFRGTGAGLGTTPPSTTEWKTGFVNNRCFTSSLQRLLLGLACTPSMHASVHRCLSRVFVGPLLRPACTCAPLAALDSQGC